MAAFYAFRPSETRSPSGHETDMASLTDDVGSSGQSGLTTDIAETTRMTHKRHSGAHFRQAPARHGASNGRRRPAQHHALPEQWRARSLSNLLLELCEHTELQPRAQFGGELAVSG